MATSSTHVHACAGIRGRVALRESAHWAGAGQAAHDVSGLRLPSQGLHPAQRSPSVDRSVHSRLLCQDAALLLFNQLARPCLLTGDLSLLWSQPDGGPAAGELAQSAVNQIKYWSDLCGRTMEFAHVVLLDTLSGCRKRSARTLQTDIIHPQSRL